jgi:hypothetical protein
LRLLALAAFIALGACAQQQAPRVWYRPDGTPVSYGQMHTALLACGSEMVGTVQRHQLPPAASVESTSMHDYEDLQQSPAFNRLSQPEMNACLLSYGFRAEPLTGSGSSLPPPR